jgi:hypothetical protein
VTPGLDMVAVARRVLAEWQIGHTWALLPEAGMAWTSTANFMTDESRLFHVGIAALWTH